MVLILRSSLAVLCHTICCPMLTARSGYTLTLELLHRSDHIASPGNDIQSDTAGNYLEPSDFVFPGRSESPAWSVCDQVL